MKKRTIVGLGVCALAIGAIVGVIGTRTAKEVKAGTATETTVYFVISDEARAGYSVKLNTNQQTNPDSWKSYDMTLVPDKTYQSNPIYTCTYTDLWGGVAEMQFQLYDGETWKSQDVAISAWSDVANYNGKMWVHGGTSWAAYTWDGDPEPPASSSEETATDYFVVGDFNTWTAGETVKMALSDEKKDGKDQYYLSLTGLLKDQQFKVKSSKNEWFPASNMTIPANGDYTVFFVPEGGVTDWTAGGGYIYLNLDKEGGDVELDYFAVGDFNEWKAKDETYKLTKMGEKKNEKDQYEITIEGLEKDSKIKMMSSASAYFPSGTGNDYVIPADGDYTFYFVPDGGITDEGWWNGYFYAALQEDPGTSSSEGGSASSSSSKSAESTGTGLYVRGTAVSGWDVDPDYELVEHGTDLGCILNVTLSVGDFKIGNADWSKQWGWQYQNDDEESAHVTVIGGAKDNFEKAEGETNYDIHCKVAAAYDIYLTANNYISIELHDQPTPIGDYFFVSTGNYGDGAKAYLYTWNSDEDKNADFPGLEINATNYPAATCTSGTNFNNAGGIWEIPTSVLKAKFIITIEAPTSEEDPTPVEKAKSGDIVAADGIYVAPSATTEEAAGSVGIALQAKLVKDIEAAIVATENDTVCEVTQATAEALVDRYDHLTSRTAIDAATYWTYDGSKGYDIVSAETPAYDNISYADIVEQLRVIAGQNAGAWNVQSTANNLTLIITVSVIGAGLAAAGAMYLISKKRRLQK